MDRLMLQRAVEGDDIAAEGGDHPPGQGVVEPGEKSEGKVDAESQSHGRQVNGNGSRTKIHKESSND